MINIDDHLAPSSECPPSLLANAIEVFAPSGEYLPAKRITGVEFPTGVALDPTSGDIYVSGYFGQVKVFTSAQRRYRSDGFPFSPSLPASRSTPPVATFSSPPAPRRTSRSSTNPGDADQETRRRRRRRRRSGGPGVFVDAAGEIVHYDASGNRLDSFGQGNLTKSLALA